jgi:hypothetical protein
MGRGSMAIDKRKARPSGADSFEDINLQAILEMCI